MDEKTFKSVMDGSFLPKAADASAPDDGEPKSE